MNPVTSVRSLTRRLAGFRRLDDISGKSLRNLPLMRGGSNLGASMGWWFGRKSAPADVRPFVPAWLTNTADEEGFARSTDGMSLFVKSIAAQADYHSGAWEIGTLRGTSVVIAGQQVVGSRLSAIASPAAGATVDSGARSTIDQILNALRVHGLIQS
jgi:hypothetical protein